MGCFDTFHVNCPKCGTRHSEQSKAHDCGLRDYDLTDVPVAILADVSRKTFHCDCGTSFKVHAPVSAAVVSLPERREDERWGDEERDFY
jgi:hypothetical protein